MSRRERTRGVGLSGNYWYAALVERTLRAGDVQEVRFWNTSIAVFRGEDGQVRAVEDRCAHRQLRLSRGDVVRNDIVCKYHGWKYNGEGRCVDVGHDLPGKQERLPKVCIRSYPVQVKY